MIGARFVLATMLVTTSLHAEEHPYTGGPLPPNGHIEWRRDQEVVEAAAVSMAGFYIMSVFAGWIGDAVCNGSCTDHGYDLLYLPLVGPAIAAALPGVQRESPAWSVILVADSAFQIASGLVALVADLIPTKRVVVTAREHSPTWMVTPGARGAPLGLTFSLAAF